MFLFLVKNLKKETSRLHNELLQHKMNTAELKRKVAALEAKLQASEEENTLLRNLNEIFGDENDKYWVKMNPWRKKRPNSKNFEFLLRFLLDQKIQLAEKDLNLVLYLQKPKARMNRTQ